jgi:hypothetical protein
MRPVASTRVDARDTLKAYRWAGGDFFDFLAYRGSVTEDEARALFLQILSGTAPASSNALPTAHFQQKQACVACVIALGHTGKSHVKAKHVRLLRLHLSDILCHCMIQGSRRREFRAWLL